MTDEELLALCRSDEYHYDCEDCWYSCPKSGNCCNATVGDECTCGYDRRVKEKMALYKAGYRAAMDHLRGKIKRRYEVLDDAVEGCDGDELEDIEICNRELMRFEKWLDEQVKKEGA